MPITTCIVLVALIMGIVIVACYAIDENNKRKLAEKTGDFLTFEHLKKVEKLEKKVNLLENKLWGQAVNNNVQYEDSEFN